MQSYGTEEDQKIAFFKGSFLAFKELYTSHPSKKKQIYWKREDESVTNHGLGAYFLQTKSTVFDEFGLLVNQPKTLPILHPSNFVKKKRVFGCKCVKKPRPSAKKRFHSKKKHVPLPSYQASDIELSLLN